MTQQQPNNPLHGLSLQKIVTQLVEHYGWEGLYREVRVNCFSNDPSIKSSLKFLRKTPWARDKVEALYIQTFC
ncbi:transporter [Vibrio sp. qd031]|uniref:VF530 family protein n=1 Tax=Vibrio sp. qd031 TaxID=1603038 RepID=UPI000A0F5844|nr:VF530 family protein [Vibrio sp. qd031]ORT48769.1 transporter [Vibrio sp. qd031]